VIKKRTVVVVGAGASQEVGMPTGTQLRQIVARLLDFRIDAGKRYSGGDAVILEALRLAVPTFGGDLQPLVEACWTIRDTMPQAMSIDNLIDVHQGKPPVVLSGKLAIARSIVEAERRSTLFNAPSRAAPMDFAVLEDTWLSSFFQLLTESCPVERLPERLASLTLVVFNYDRCIEHFLYHALQNYYRIPATQAAQLTRTTRIIHPYGMVGTLPWAGSAGSVAFGGNASPSQLLRLAGDIKTFGERTDPRDSDVPVIRERMHHSETVVFLGFAFHRANLQLICGQDSDAVMARDSRFWATAKGLSGSDCEAIKYDLARRLGVRPGFIQLHSLTCSQLLRARWRDLSFV
jgi:hypothetical protein